MFNKWFKKKVSPENAATELINILIQAARDDWEEDKALLSGLNTEINDRTGSFEILLATIAMELLAVKNITPHFYQRIYTELMDVLSKSDELGYYSIRTLGDYITAIKLTEIKGHPPDEGIIIILARQLSIKLDPLSETVIRGILVRKLGIWKFITNHFKIVS